MSINVERSLPPYTSSLSRDYEQVDAAIARWEGRKHVINPEQPLLRNTGTINLVEAIGEVKRRNTEWSTHFDRTIWLVESETKTVHLTAYRPDEIQEGVHMHVSSNYLFIVEGQFRVGLLNEKGEWEIETKGQGEMLFFEPYTPHLVAPTGDNPEALSIIMVMTFPGVSTRPDAQYNLEVPPGTPPLPQAA